MQWVPLKYLKNVGAQINGNFIYLYNHSNRNEIYPKRWLFGQILHFHRTIIAPNQKISDTFSFGADAILYVRKSKYKRIIYRIVSLECQIQLINGELKFRDLLWHDSPWELYIILLVSGFMFNTRIYSCATNYLSSNIDNISVSLPNFDICETIHKK